MNYKITAITGSLRKDSYNTLLLHALKKLGEKINLSINIETLGDIPFYSEDLEAKEIPKSIRLLAEEVRNSDAVIISTPEYNGTTSGVLLNTMEWLSRGSVNKPLENKALGVVGATTGGFGTDKAQVFVKTLGLALGMLPMNSPKLRVSHADKKFNDGKLMDRDVKIEIEGYLNILKEWVNKFSSK